MGKVKDLKNLSDAINEEEFKEKSEMLLKDKDAETVAYPKKPILSESEIKVKKARRTKFAVAAFVLLLGVGIMGNWYYENTDFASSVKPVISTKSKTLGEAELVDATTNNVEVKRESEYFSSARLDRQSARDESIEKLQNIIDDEKSSAEVKKTATEGIARISDTINIENKIESLVTAKGADNCIAVVNEDSTRVDIIVDVPELSDSLILQIKEIAMQQLGCSFKDVSIIQSK